MSNIDHILRQMRIDLITDNPNRTIMWFEEIWNKLQSFTAKAGDKYDLVSDQEIYYMDQKLMFMMNKTFINCTNEFWSDVVEMMYNHYKIGVSYHDVQVLCIFLFDYKMDNRKGIPIIFDSMDVQNHFQKLLYNKLKEDSHV